MVDFLVQQVSTIPVVCLFHIKYFKWYVIGNKVNKSKKPVRFLCAVNFSLMGVITYLKLHRQFLSLELQICSLNWFWKKNWSIKPLISFSHILLRALPALNHVICPSFMEWLSSIVSEPPSAWVILHWRGCIKRNSNIVICATFHNKCNKY